MNLARHTSPLYDLDTFNIMDDFGADQSDVTWIDTITDTGTVLMGDEDNGVATLTPSDGTVADNDEVYLATANANFRLLANRELSFIARLQFVETAAGIYNVAAGFASSVAANLLVDDGGGLRASGAVIAIYKVDGESVWRCVSRNGTAVTVTQSTKAAVGATWYQLKILIKDWDGVSQQVAFMVDGEYLKDSNGLVIRHTVPLASAAQMQAFIGAKLGAITNNDTTKVDFVYCDQVR